MQTVKKIGLILIAALVFSAAINMVQAISLGIDCEVVENPQNNNLKCTGSDLFFYGIPEKIEILESPMVVGSVELTEMQNELEEKAGQQYEAFSIKPKYLGKYIFRINDSYNVTVLYGQQYALQEQNKMIILGITGIAGIALIAVGAALAIKKKPVIGGALLIVGLIILAIGAGIIFA